MQCQEVENVFDVECEWVQIILVLIGDGVIIVDIQGGIFYFNLVVEQMINWMLDKVCGLFLVLLFWIVDESLWEEGMLLIEQIFSGEIDGGCEYFKLVLCYDGSSVLVILVGVLIYCGGEIIGVVLVFYDMICECQYMVCLFWQVIYDVLIGLINCCEFEYCL